MLDLTIYSYGYSEIIYQTLQAIAMFRNMDFYTTMGHYGRFNQRRYLFYSDGYG